MQKIGSMNLIKDSKAMIFAAGLGTRLKPFTDHHPKALAQVNGQSLLQRNLNYLHAFGISDFVINVHHFADQIIDELKRLSNDQWKFAISHEIDGPYETGGGLAFASEKLLGSDQPFIVMNVDILTNLDLTGMFDYHQKINPLVTLAVTDRKSSRQFLFDEEMKLVGWRNNSTSEEKWVQGVVESVKPFSFSGIHIIHPHIFKYLPASGTFSIVDVYLKIAKDELVIAYDHTGDLVLDVGKPEALAKAEELFK
jgi:NDP-sugar pyrophosphorylase family protein